MIRRLLYLATLLILLASLSPGLAAEKVKVSTPVKMHPIFALPALAAEEKGFWKEQGLEGEWVPFSASTPMYQAVVAGSILIGMDDVTGTVQATSRGVPVVVAGHLGVEQDQMIYVRADSPIKEGKELRGKKVGILRPGGPTYAYAALALKAIGLEKDVKLVGSGGIPEETAALKTGAIDAMGMSYIGMAALVVAGEIRPVLAARDYLPKEWVTRVIFARKDLLEQKPEVAARVIKAILKSTDFIMKDQRWAIDKMKSFFNYSEAVAKDIYPRLNFSKDGKLDPKGMVNVRQFLIDFGLVPKDKAPAVEELYSLKALERIS